MPELTTEFFASQTAEIFDHACSEVGVRITFVVGNELQPMRSIRRFSTVVRLMKEGLAAKKDAAGLARLEAEQESPSGQDRIRWKFHEHARFVSANGQPVKTYFYIVELARNDAIDAVITTNYDLWLDSLMMDGRFPARGVLNPQADLGLADRSDGYYAIESRARVPKIWKVHGSLSHVSFRKCHCLFRLPRFIVGRADEGFVTFGRFSHRHYIERRGGQSPRAECIAGDCGEYVHHLDTNYEGSVRDTFGPEITAACSHIANCSDRTCIILVGFRGSEVEELNKPLIDRVRRRLPVLAIFSSDQARDSKLLAALRGEESFVWSVGSVTSIFNAAASRSSFVERWRERIEADYFDRGLIAYDGSDVLDWGVGS
ncbi:hypothetical protein FJY68_09785 [candidate division WOR-3 bacterium]|uniref:SIR2-like domain-containing protein n=1 Tax=candidate division WOR-3 bacterium TaxID=2052148 RepID=A0A937XEV8_UNCW3|nr:hypothetical protein [candidate division WOR-3 bacterium]